MTKISKAAIKANRTRQARKTLRNEYPTSYIPAIDITRKQFGAAKTLSPRYRAIKANMNRPGRFRDLCIAANLATCNE